MSGFLQALYGSTGNYTPPAQSIGEITNISASNLITHSQFSTPEGNTTYWPRVYKSIEWPEFTTTKDYFVIWSTDHVALTSGAIYWGEMDSPDYTGFTGWLGKIVTGDQAETPYLKRIPKEISGLTSDEVFLYYHTAGEAGNVVYQETRLITTSGGNEPHLCIWNDRGRPLGVYNDDVHTGYAQVFGEIPPFIASHLTVGGANSKSYISESNTGLNFTRKLRTDELLLPNGSNFSKLQMCPFMHNGNRLAFVMERLDPERYICLVELDENYLPKRYLQRLTPSIDIRTMTHYIEGNTACIYYSGGSNTNNNEPNYFITCDISTL